MRYTKYQKDMIGPLDQDIEREQDPLVREKFRRVKRAYIMTWEKMAARDRLNDEVRALLFMALDLRAAAMAASRVAAKERAAKQAKRAGKQKGR